MKTESPVCCLYHLENFGVTVPQRICRPAILKVDITIAVKIPDEITLRPVDNNLPHRTKTTPTSPLHFSIEPQPILEKRNTALECRERPRTWKTFTHDLKPPPSNAPGVISSGFYGIAGYSDPKSLSWSSGPGAHAA